MKKKSPRGIPDFSHKPAQKKNATAPELGHGARVQTKSAPPPPPRVKPPSTSVKSGQRGQ